jgi:uncharacterized membrane protein YhhN
MLAASLPLLPSWRTRGTRLTPTDAIWLSSSSVALTFAVAALLVAEWRDSRLGVWVAKPLASTCFIAAAFAAGALDSRYGVAVLTGLVLSWFGDVFLIPRAAPRVFLSGVLSFLLGHVAYVVAFAGRGFDTSLLLPVGLGAVVAALAAGTWLWPHVETEMRIAVVAYIGVISVMLVAAVGTYALRANPWLLVGAVGFYLSDLAVARDRFVESVFVNRLWGLPLYYGAQLALAWSITLEVANRH